MTTLYEKKKQTNYLKIKININILILGIQITYIHTYIIRTFIHHIHTQINVLII